jgi:hypothetical protein
MTNEEFKILLKEVFKTYTLMNKRDYHTINELMHCLRYDKRMLGFNFNISVIKANGEYCCIPAIDAFVDINTLGVWFDDDKVEYEHEYVDNNGFLFYFDNITIYEREEK